MQEPRILELIGKALSGQASKRELSEIKRWLQESDENEALYEILRLGYDHTKTTLKVDNSDEVYKRMMARVNSRHEKSHYQIKHKDSKILSIGRWQKIAAAIAFIAILGYSFFQLFHEENKPVVENKKMIEKKTSQGQRLQVRLPDGSFVWLNSESRISYPEVFSDSLRNVDLVGEAFFEVKKDPDKPMIVKSGNIITTVLGTSFNVNAYPENDQLEISLVVGKIKVSNYLDKSAVLLEEGYAFDYLKKNREAKIREIDQRSLNWKKGILSFEDEPFDSFVEKIERWYGVKVVVQGKIKEGWLLNGEFDNVSLEELMNHVTYGSGFGYKIRNDSLRIFN